MNCCACNSPLQRLMMDCLEQQTIHHCPKACHVIVAYHNGSQKEYFNLEIKIYSSADNYETVIVEVENFSEVSILRRMQHKNFSCIIRKDGWELAKGDFLISPGTRDLSLNLSH